MRNKINEATIDHVIDESQYSEAFKSALKAFVKNKFSENAKESDLKRVLTLLDIGDSESADIEQLEIDEE